MCCPEFRSRWIESTIWTINNVPEIPRTLVSVFVLLALNDRSFIPQLRAAWQRRIDAAPDDPNTYINMGEFLKALAPNDACQYYERALALEPGDELVELAFATARHLAHHSVDEKFEDDD